ncbi:Fic family protein [Taylorella equigenitalis]|uniref:Filamentation induced by cAMP (Fic) family protein n=1 Tax=Taylorella equigenitalis ATCC 35865 TaxID=743973 RepID=A0ABN4AZB7_9BURK|nr:Fic family protein [Taylorella equigenitalis]AFN36304.1 filamentation induced by cAMP (Fic) family protein [Taylorella equigenitalis ATCC 35865]ASY39705.1 cell filamentation protein Fic [Taylorella equigenitalis]VEG32163.1 death-on-curing family protein [Taylorella equigenitalis ATCC 35865]
MKYIGLDNAVFIAYKLRDEFIYNMAKAEGNSLTFAETSTVIEGYGISGKSMFELRQVENIRNGWDYVINLVKYKELIIDKNLFVKINSLVARDENPSHGEFREKSVAISGTNYLPPQPFILNSLFREMIDNYKTNSTLDLKKSAMDLFLDSARNQYFEDGNKRTGQLVMNAMLMKNGYAPFTYPPEVDKEFKNKLINFYIRNNKEEMYDFIRSQINSPRLLHMQNVKESSLKISYNDGLTM